MILMGVETFNNTKKLANYFWHANSNALIVVVVVELLMLLMVVKWFPLLIEKFGREFLGWIRECGKKRRGEKRGRRRTTKW